MASAGAAAAAGAEAVSGAATDGAITDTAAEDGGEDAGAGVGATAAGRGGVAKAEEAMAAGVEAFDGERYWPMECRIGKPCKNVDCVGGTGVISDTCFLRPSGNATRVGTVGRDTAAEGGDRGQNTEGAQITDAG